MSQTRRAYQFTEAEAETLLSLVQDQQREGTYWGNKAQFEKRLRRIVAILERTAPPKEDV